MNWRFEFIKDFIYFSNKKKHYILIIIFTAFLSGIDTLSLIILPRFLIDAATNQDIKTFVLISFFMILAVFAGTLINYITPFITDKLLAIVMNRLRVAIANQIMFLSYSSIKNNHSGKRISQITTGLNSVEDFIKNHFANFFYSSVVIIGTVIYFITIDVMVMLMSVITILVGTIISSCMSRMLQRYAESLQEEMSNLTIQAQEMIRGNMIIKAFNLGKKLLSKNRHTLECVSSIETQIAKRKGAISVVLNTFEYAPLIICVIYVGRLAINGEISAGTVVVFISLLGYLGGPIKNLPLILSEYRQMLGNYKFVKAIFQEEQESIEGIEILNRHKTAVEFKSVNFGYKNENNIINSLSLKFQSGKKYALVGSSGSGKSTILSLICGLYEPQQGEVYLYNKDLRKLSKQVLRDKISYVSQDVDLLPDSIKNNISFGKDGYTTSEIESAAKKANIHDYILSLEDGYDTLIGEGGKKLSGGQQQRIAIARSLLKKSEIYLFDEATSALDNESEKYIQESIYQISKDHTVIIVAHRLSTVMGVDEIIVLESGKIVEQGNHKRLLNNKGRYFELYGLQHMAYKS